MEWDGLVWDGTYEEEKKRRRGVKPNSTLHSLGDEDEDEGWLVDLF
jgi:hypothetical protein